MCFYLVQFFRFAGHVKQSQTDTLFHVLFPANVVQCGRYSTAQHSTSMTIFYPLPATNFATNSKLTSISNGCIVYQRPDKEPQNPLTATGTYSLHFIFTKYYYYHYQCAFSVPLCASPSSVSRVICSANLPFQNIDFHNGLNMYLSRVRTIILLWQTIRHKQQQQHNLKDSRTSY